MRHIERRPKRIFRAVLISTALAAGSIAAHAHASDGESSDSVIDLLIEWIEDVFNPDFPAEEPPADDSSW